MILLFTDKKLEELKEVDKKIDEEDYTLEDYKISREIDKILFPLIQARGIKEKKTQNEAHKENKKAYNKAYYNINREAKNLQNKAYYKANKDKRKAYHKAYYEKNKEKINARHKANYEANKKINKGYNSVSKTG